MQVFTRLRLAALCLKWNPSGSSFAIGSSERLICICHRDKVCTLMHITTLQPLCSRAPFHAHLRKRACIYDIMTASLAAEQLLGGPTHQEVP